MEENDDVNNVTQSKAGIPPTVGPDPAVLEAERRQGQKVRLTLIIIAVAVVIFIVAGMVFLFTRSPQVTSQIRDVFIIFMALESLVIGVALVILMIQLAILINLLQNEIKPILTSTNETVNTVRGTVRFLSDNLAGPVIKLNEYLAGFNKLLDILRIGRK